MKYFVVTHTGRSCLAEIAPICEPDGKRDLPVFTGLNSFGIRGLVYVDLSSRQIQYNKLHNNVEEIQEAEICRYFRTALIIDALKPFEKSAVLVTIKTSVIDIRVKTTLSAFIDAFTQRSDSNGGVWTFARSTTTAIFYWYTVGTNSIVLKVAGV